MTITARVQIYGTVGGEMTCNELHFQTPAEFDVPAQLLDLATRLRDFWCNNPCALNAYAYQKYNRVKVMHVSSSPVAPVELTFSITGSWASSNDWTPMVCAVLQFRTGVGGRRGRGRHFLGGWDPFARTEGRWEASIQIKLNAVAQAIEDFWVNTTNPNYKGNGWILGVRGRALDDSFLSVTEVIGRPTLGVQRRRQLEVGA